MLAHWSRQMLARCSSDSSITYYCKHLFHNHCCFHAMSCVLLWADAVCTADLWQSAVPRFPLLLTSPFPLPAPLRADPTRTGVLTSLISLRLLCTWVWFRGQFWGTLTRFVWSPGTCKMRSKSWHRSPTRGTVSDSSASRAR